MGDIIERRKMERKTERLKDKRETQKDSYTEIHEETDKKTGRNTKRETERERQYGGQTDVTQWMCPSRAAMCRGVSPCRLTEDRGHPAFRTISAISALPANDAQCTHTFISCIHAHTHVLVCSSEMYVCVCVRV